MLIQSFTNPSSGCSGILPQDGFHDLQKRDSVIEVDPVPGPFDLMEVFSLFHGRVALAEESDLGLVDQGRLRARDDFDGASPLGFPQPELPDEADVVHYDFEVGQPAVVLSLDVDDVGFHQSGGLGTVGVLFDLPVDSAGLLLQVDRRHALQHRGSLLEGHILRNPAGTDVDDDDPLHDLLQLRILLGQRHQRQGPHRVAHQSHLLPPSALPLSLFPDVIVQVVGEVFHRVGGRRRGVSVVPAIYQVRVDIVRDRWVLAEAPKIFGTPHQPVMHDHRPRPLVSAPDAEERNRILDAFAEGLHFQF